MGGLARLGTLVERARAEADGVLLVDAGDALTGPQVLPAQRARRARLIVDSYRALGLAAMATGELDRQAEVDRSRLPAGGVIRRGGLSIGLLSADLEATPASTLAALAERARRLRRQGAQLVVALLHGGAGKPTELLAPGGSGIDVAVLSHAQQAGTALRQLGSTWVVEAPPQGKVVGRLDLHVVDGQLRFVDIGGRGQVQTRIHDAGRELGELAARYQRAPGELRDFYARRRAEIEGQIAADKKLLLLDAAGPAGPPPTGSWLENRQVPLGADIPDSAEVARLLARYKREVATPGAPAATTSAGTAEAPVRGSSAEAAGYTGGLACRGCHPAAYAFWSGTRHAQAWKALEKDGQQRDPACVVCHVTARLLALPDVQCEACHGPGRAHQARPEEKGLIARDSREEQCTVCHRPPQAREWEYRSFRAATLGKGHGST